MADKRRSYYVADWFRSEPDEGAVLLFAKKAFERAERQDGVKLGPPRRSHEDEAFMLANQHPPPGFDVRIVRVYVADVIDE